MVWHRADDDALMSMMQDHMLGDHYTNGAWLHEGRLARIDRFVEALRQEGLIPADMPLDRPLERAAVHAILEALFAPHYAPFAGIYPGDARNGRDPSDLYMAALTEHLLRHGFTREHAARFNNEAPEDVDAHRAYANEFWGKFGPQGGPPSTRPHHQYTGRAGASLLGRMRASGF